METIYVALRNEGVEVWRPVQATSEGNSIFQIGSAESDPGEKWEFAPGSRVRCELRELSDGQALVAVAAA
jgi:hypothetical protein